MLFRCARFPGRLRGPRPESGTLILCGERRTGSETARLEFNAHKDHVRNKLYSSRCARLPCSPSLPPLVLRRPRQTVREQALRTLSQPSSCMQSHPHHLLTTLHVESAGTCRHSSSPPGPAPLTLTLPCSVPRPFRLRTQPTHRTTPSLCRFRTLLPSKSILHV